MGFYLSVFCLLDNGQMDSVGTTRGDFDLELKGGRRLVKGEPRLRALAGATPPVPATGPIIRVGALRYQCLII